MLFASLSLVASVGTFSLSCGHFLALSCSYVPFVFVLMLEKRLMGSPPPPNMKELLEVLVACFVGHSCGKHTAEIGPAFKLTPCLMMGDHKQKLKLPLQRSPWAHLDVVGMLQPAELAHSFLFCCCASFRLPGPFNCI